MAARRRSRWRYGHRRRGLGAHGLQRIAGPDAVRWWAIATAIQLVTAPVILGVSALLPRGRARPLTCWLLLLGTLLFSGSLYWMALGGPCPLGAVTPLGGLALMGGWLLLAWPPKKHT